MESKMDDDEKLAACSPEAELKEQWDREYEEMEAQDAAFDVMLTQRYLAPFYGRLLPPLDGGDLTKELRWYDAIELLVREFGLDLYEALYCLRQYQREREVVLTTWSVRVLGQLVTDPDLHDPGIIEKVKDKSWFPELVRRSEVARYRHVVMDGPTAAAVSDNPREVAVGDAPRADDGGSGTDD